jgi:hypothetical protein
LSERPDPTKEEEMPIPPGRIGPGEPALGNTIKCYEGVSEFRHESNAESLHEAIQKAAEAAISDLELQPGDFKDLEIARIQVRVGGNPNVKVYRVEMSEAG